MLLADAPLLIWSRPALNGWHSRPTEIQRQLDVPDDLMLAPVVIQSNSDENWLLPITNYTGDGSENDQL